MLSIAVSHKKDHATAAPKAWSLLLRDPTVDRVSRAENDDEIEYKARLGATIVQLRGIRGLSQAELAVAISRSEPTLSRWELGKSQPSAYDLTQLAQVLNAPPEMLLDPPEKAISPVAARLAAARSAQVAVQDEAPHPPVDDDDPVEEGVPDQAHG